MSISKNQGAVPTDEPLRMVREQVAEKLRIEILSGRWDTGDRLREIPLAKELGVGRGHIRDALLQLTREGVLIYKPNCGVEVASSVHDEVRPLLVSLRTSNETHALKSVIHTLTGDDFRDWAGVLESLRQAGEADDLEAVVEQDMAFHRWIVDRPGRAELPSVWLPIVMRLRLVYSRHTNLREVYPEHLVIFNLARELKADEAAIALANHIQ